MTQNFTIEQYLAAIDREICKRATTYPKMLEKLRKAPIKSASEVEKTVQLYTSINKLKWVKRIIIEKIDFLDPATSFLYLHELQREYKMRKKCYPRFVFFKRIDELTANAELSIWRELTTWFAEQYCGIQDFNPECRLKSKL